MHIKADELGTELFKAKGLACFLSTGRDSINLFMQYSIF
jgi:hypothetical protein